MKSRLTAVKSLLREKSCSHILISDTVDVQYISGFDSTNAYLLISEKRNLLISDFRYKEAGIKHCLKNRQWKFIEISQNSFAFLRPLIPPHSRVGIQSNSLSVDAFDQIKHQCKKISFIKLSDTVSDLCIPKLPAEIAAVNNAAKIGDRALKSLLHYIKPGITEKQLTLHLEDLCKEYGSERPSFDTIVLFGSRSALPHGKPTSAKLKKGDFILIDFGCTKDGLCSDMTRTMVFGKATEKQKNIYSVVLNAQKMARNKARAGILASKLDSFARDIIDKAGFGEHFRHGTGHGVGRRIHENPCIASRVNKPLPSKAIVTIEPGIYLPDFGGVRIEDMVLLEKQSTTVLTHSPRKLLEIGL